MEAVEEQTLPHELCRGSGRSLDSIHTDAMKPAAQPIDPTKRSDAPPPVVLTREIAGTTMRVFMAMLVLPLMFEISSWVSPSKAKHVGAGGPQHHAVAPDERTQRGEPRGFLGP